MGYKTKSMLHLHSADPKKNKEDNNKPPAAKGSYSNPGSNLFPAYKPKVTAATSIGGSDAEQMGNMAAQLAFGLIGSGAGRSTSNFDRKIEAKKEKGNLAGSARAERREAKWDYRQKKSAEKTLAKTEGLYLSKRKEKKIVEGLNASDRKSYNINNSRLTPKIERIASEHKDNQLRRSNAGKEEAKPTGDTGSSVTNITNTGTGGFGKSGSAFGGSSNYKNWGEEHLPNFNIKNRFLAITPKKTPNVNVDKPGKGGKSPTEELTEKSKGPVSNIAVTLDNAKMGGNPTQNEKDKATSRKYAEMQRTKAEQKVGAGEQDNSYDAVIGRENIQKAQDESNERRFNTAPKLPTIN
tara:strand:+ start:1110 stop:2165 length:1056 start_codon:yes stop_codon:yes gene_type:complete